MPLGPLTVKVFAATSKVTPAGKTTGSLPILDIANLLLPNVGEYFAAVMLFSRFPVGHNALRGGYDGNSHAVKHFGKVVATGVNSQARLGNSL